MQDKDDASRPDFLLPREFGTALPTGVVKNAVEKLGRRIANDEYPDGEPIPTEPELAESLGVSKTAGRDAIKVLSGKGMVRTARRYGTRVRPISEWHLLDADVVSWHDATHPRMAQMFIESTELRCIIEPAAAELAAERATPEQVEAILDATSALRPDAVDSSLLYEADCRFHCTILDATGNQMMRQLRPMIMSVLRISYEFGVQTDRGEPVSRKGHLLVAKAIQNKDGIVAKFEMEKMLEANRRTARAYWENKNKLT